MSTVSVRYIVDDVDAAIGFYCDQLGFDELMHPDPAFAMLTRGDLRLLLASPVPADHHGGGSRPMPDAISNGARRSSRWVAISGSSAGPPRACATAS